MNDLAILVEPKRVDRDVSYTTFDKKPGTRDECTADITIFGNSGSLEKGEPTEVIKSAKVVHGMLVDTLGKIIDQATVATLAKVATKNGSGYVWRDASAENAAYVEAYFEKRDAAIAAAIADAPDFD